MTLRERGRREADADPIVGGLVEKARPLVACVGDGARHATLQDERLGGGAKEFAQFGDRCARVEPRRLLVAIVEHHWHAVVDGADHGVRLGRDQREGAQRPAVGLGARGGEAGEGEVCAVGGEERPRLFRRLRRERAAERLEMFGILPLVKGVDRHDHATALVGVAKARQALNGFGARVEEAVAELLVFRPVRHEPPARRRDDARARSGIERCDDECARGGGKVPAWRPGAADRLHLNACAEFARDLVGARCLHNASTHGVKDTVEDHGAAAAAA